MNTPVARTTQRATPLKSLADIAVVAAYLIFVPPLAETALAGAGLSMTGLTRIAATAVLFTGLVVVVVAVLALHGETVRDIGLKKPASTPGAIVLGVAVAGLIFVGLAVLQRTGVMGETRLGDMATELKGNVVLALARTGLSLIMVGFVEEFVFRGFVLDRIAKAFGAGALALSIAVPGQAVLFGLAHAYQGREGMLFTGAVGLVLGVVFIATGRNLWPVIIAHSVFDAARAVHLYYAQTVAS